MKKDGIYKLQRYTWRTLLTFIGPWLVVAYYAFICFAFLRNPPSNDIVPHIYVDAQWIFYAWFVLAILMLDWARAGLANIEAAALMHPRLAPSTASELMWHTDSKWANPLWWLRAGRAAVVSFYRRIRSRSNHKVSAPDWPWVLLALTSLLLIVSLPLSSLTMEARDVFTYTNTRAKIFGPNSTTFNPRNAI